MSYPTLGFDPAPGRPQEVASLAADIGRGARHLHEATTQLDRVRRSNGL